jgi:flagellar basal body-associated protein FliL
MHHEQASTVKRQAELREVTMLTIILIVLLVLLLTGGGLGYSRRGRRL